MHRLTDEITQWQTFIRSWLCNSGANRHEIWVRLTKRVKFEVWKISSESAKFHCMKLTMIQTWFKKSYTHRLSTPEDKGLIQKVNIFCMGNGHVHAFNTPTKHCANWMRASHLIFASEKNRPLLLSKGGDWLSLRVKPRLYMIMAVQPGMHRICEYFVQLWNIPSYVCIPQSFQCLILQMPWMNSSVITRVITLCIYYSYNVFLGALIPWCRSLWYICVKNVVHRFSTASVSLILNNFRWPQPKSGKIWKEKFGSKCVTYRQENHITQPQSNLT